MEHDHIGRSVVLELADAAVDAIRGRAPAKAAKELEYLISRAVLISEGKPSLHWYERPDVEAIIPVLRRPRETLPPELVHDVRRLVHGGVEGRVYLKLHGAEELARSHGCSGLAVRALVREVLTNRRDLDEAVAALALAGPPDVCEVCSRLRGRRLCARCKRVEVWERERDRGQGKGKGHLPGGRAPAGGGPERRRKVRVLPHTFGNELYQLWRYLDDLSHNGTADFPEPQSRALLQAVYKIQRKAAARVLAAWRAVAVYQMRLKAGLMSFRHAGLRKAFNTWQVWAALVKEVAHDDTFVRYKPTWEKSTKVEPKPIGPEPDPRRRRQQQQQALARQGYQGLTRAANMLGSIQTKSKAGSNLVRMSSKAQKDILAYRLSQERAASRQAMGYI